MGQGIKTWDLPNKSSAKNLAAAFGDIDMERSKSRRKANKMRTLRLSAGYTWIEVLTQLKRLLLPGREGKNVDTVGEGMWLKTAWNYKLQSKV